VREAARPGHPKMAWQGEADLDMKVTERGQRLLGAESAVGRPAAPDRRQHHGHDREGQVRDVLAAQAFSGEYTIDVHRVLGQSRPPTKAQLRIIRHQGRRMSTSSW